MKNVALLGAGRIGRIHAANLAALPGVRLSTVCDPSPEAAAEVAARHGAAVSASIDTVFADPSVHVVVVASPTTTHHDLILKAAAARKHVFCEKPIDLSVERAQACADAVAAAGIACMIGFQRRFDPTFSAAQERIARGEIGKPEMLVITSRDPAPPPVDYIRQSGGIFRDMLIHDFDVFRWLLCDEGRDEAVWLQATGACLVDPAIGRAGDIDSALVILRTRSGRLCTINTSRRAAYGYDQRFEVLCAEGLIECGNLRPTEVTMSNGHGVHHDKPEHFFLQRYQAAYRAEIEHFFECLRDGRPTRTTVQDGLAAQRLADAAARSYETGQPVQL